MLSKNEISRAVTALRELTDVIERIEKATWPESQSDVLRKVEPVGAPVVSAADAALAALANLQRRVDELKAADAARASDDAMRKTYRVQS
jgi:hypothetical protein